MVVSYILGNQLLQSYAWNTIKRDIYASPNFRIFVSKTGGLFFAEFNFHGHQHLQKIIPILFCENHRVCDKRKLINVTLSKSGQSWFIYNL